MMQLVLIGIGAGIASALLFASIISGSTLAFALANFAQLPIMIAAIGWTHLVGLAAVFVAATVLAATLGGTIALAFVISIALPAWWIGYLSLLGRPSADGTNVEWYPVGRIVVWIAIAAAAVVALTTLRYGLDLTQLQAGLRREMELGVRFLTRTPLDAPLQVPQIKEPERLIDALVLVVPPLKTAALTLTITLNLWLAALIARASGRLKRPWPQIAQMTFPPFAPFLLAAAVAASFMPDLIGYIGGLFSASLLVVYALLGFATIHAITVGAAARGFMLTGVYLTVFLFIWPIVLMAVIGLLETVVALRARVAARRGPPAAPGSTNRS